MRPTVEELNKLSSLREAIRNAAIAADLHNRGRLLQEYDSLIEDLIHRGMTAPLPPDLELDASDWSTEYLALCENWERSQYTFQNMVRNSGHICLVQIEGIEPNGKNHLSSVRAKVLRRYKGDTPNEISISGFTVWQVGLMCQDEQKAFVFLSTGMSPLGDGACCPIFNRNAETYVKSNVPTGSFWPSTITRTPSATNSSDSWLIKLSDFERLLDDALSVAGSDGSARQ